jgi:hypothetical protein
LQQIFFLLGVRLFLREVDVGFNVAGNCRELFVCGNLLFGALPLPQDTLRGFLIIPKIGVGDARFESFQAFAILRRVKDSSARGRCAASVLRSDAGGLRGSFCFENLPICKRALSCLSKSCRH